MPNSESRDPAAFSRRGVDKMMIGNLTDISSGVQELLLKIQSMDDRSSRMEQAYRKSRKLARLQVTILSVLVLVFNLLLHWMMLRNR